MKKLLVALSLCLASCTAAIPGPQVAAQGDVTDSVVALVDDYGQPYCSGVIIDEGILTAAHCVEDELYVLVGMPHADEDGRWERAFRVLVIRSNAESDVAILQFETPGYQRLHVAASNPRVGEGVLAIGHPMGLTYVVNRGYVSRGVDSGNRFFLHNAGCLFGMSGGPVVNEAGEVLGVNSFLIGTPMGIADSFGGATSTSAVQEFLNDSR
jgi:S1-C subfamily serine protease